MYTRAQLRQHFQAANGRAPTDAELDQIEQITSGDDWKNDLAFRPLGRRIEAAAFNSALLGAQPAFGFSDIPGQRSYIEPPTFNPKPILPSPTESRPMQVRFTPEMRQRADSLIGTPYQWGGTTKQGIDCSAFISNVWGVGRQTTDTLTKVAAPVSRDELEPGDALNLPTFKDPQGYGHVRMFDGWADPEKKTMHVYESSSSTGGVVRRVLPYDPKYQPMRLNTSDAAPQRAAPIAQATAAVGATTPSRAPDQAEQKFLEANAPGESTVPVPQPARSPPAPPTPSTVNPIPPVEPVTGTRRNTSTVNDQMETPNQVAAREFKQNAGMYEGFSQRIQNAFGEPLPMPSFQLPALPPLPDFGRPPPLPPRRRFVLGV